MALGYRFLCADISIERFTERDQELDTWANNIYAVKQQSGVNFYVKVDPPERVR